MDRTSLPSFHKILGDVSNALILQEGWKIQFVEKLTGRLSIHPHRLDERSR